MPTLIFMHKGKASDVPVARFNQTQYVRLRDIKSAKVDSLKIEGPYTAAAFFKIDPDDIAEREAKRLAAGEEENNRSICSFPLAHIHLAYVRRPSNRKPL